MNGQLGFGGSGESDSLSSRWKRYSVEFIPTYWLTRSDSGKRYWTKRRGINIFL